MVAGGGSCGGGIGGDGCGSSGGSGSTAGDSFGGDGSRTGSSSSGDRNNDNHSGDGTSGGGYNGHDAAIGGSAGSSGGVGDGGGDGSDSRSCGGGGGVFLGEGMAAATGARDAQLGAVVKPHVWQAVAEVEAAQLAAEAGDAEQGEPDSMGARARGGCAEACAHSWEAQWVAVCEELVVSGRAMAAKIM